MFNIRKEKRNRTILTFYWRGFCYIFVQGLLTWLLQMWLIQKTLNFVYFLGPPQSCNGPLKILVLTIASSSMSFLCCREGRGFFFSFSFLNFNFQSALGFLSLMIYFNSSPKKKNLMEKMWFYFRSKFLLFWKYKREFWSTFKVHFFTLQKIGSILPFTWTVIHTFSNRKFRKF